MIFTALVSFFAVMLMIPDDQRQKVQDNLINGITMVVVGPEWLRLAFQTFVVMVGILILSAAVNTSIIGSNGVLNRVAEDGVLPDWFRQPQRRYGTTYRIIALVAILQIATVILSRGDETLLGEAYAFCVAFSFTMKALGVIVLRFTRPDAERWRVPLNLRLGGRELPVGLLLITTLLFLLAGINLLTKQAVTIGGLAFTLVFFTLLTVSERRARKQGIDRHPPERFRLTVRDGLSPESLGVRGKGIVVGMHDPDRLAHLDVLLDRSDPQRQDIILVAAKPAEAVHHAEGDAAQELVGEWETRIFSTRVFSTAVASAERAGKPVTLVAIEGPEAYGVILQAAIRLQSTQVIIGITGRDDQAQETQVRMAWEQLPDRPDRVRVEIVPDDGDTSTCIDLRQADATS